MASSNFYTAITVICTLMALVYLFSVKPDAAPIFMAAALPFVVGIIGTMQQSKHNTDKIEKLDAKVDVNTVVTETTHQIVNSRMDEFKQALKDIAAMKETQASLLADRAAALSALAIANERARGITIGREQVSAEGASTGSTPPHGTPKPG